MQFRGLRRVCAGLFVLLSGAYLAWRLTIFNTDAPVLSWLFFGAEAIGVALALFTIFLSWGATNRKPGPVPGNASVDVFVPTFKEPIDVIRRTLEGAVAIEYPHRTIVLDDAGRVDVRALARDLGCTYHARGENIHAKAGNLNFGLSKSTAEFVMVFDADHIPQPNAIHQLLGYFEDPRVGLAQAPQDFYNLTSLQFVNAPNGATWHDQSYFYSIILPNADRFDGGICVGTGVIYRRSALDAIGGVPTDTVTEDLHTSLKMQKAGMATAFHPASVAYGIGESRLSDYYKVRLRWAHGNIHALRHENVFFCKGLSLRQRLNYLLVGLNYLEGWQYLIFYLIPVYSLLTGVPPFEITYFNLALIIGFPLVSYLLVQEFACGFGRFWVNEIYSMIRFPVAICASAAVFRNKLSWRPTSKQQDGRIEWQMMLPQLSVVGLSLGAIVFAVIQVWGEPQTGGMSQLLIKPEAIKTIDWTAEFEAGYSLDLLLVAGFWAMLNVIRGLIFVMKIIKTARQTHADHRFRVPLMVEMTPNSEHRGAYEVEEISLSYLRLKDGSQEAWQAGATIPARLYVPSGHVDVRLTASAEEGNAFDLHWNGSEGRQVLEHALYSVDWHRRLFHWQAEFTTPLRFLARVLRLGPKDQPVQHWRPRLRQTETGERVLHYVDQTGVEAGSMKALPSKPAIIAVEPEVKVALQGQR